MHKNSKKYNYLAFFSSIIFVLCKKCPIFAPMIRLFSIPLILASLLLPAQAAAANVTDWSDEVTVFNMSDESTPWHPTRIQQDHRGLIWVSSWNGLYRYDGYEFQSFKPEPGQGVDIDNDRIREIRMAEGDTLYCRFDERICGFDVAACQFFPLPEEDRERLTLYMMEIDGIHTPPIPVTVRGLTFPDIQQEFEDRQGNIWLKGTDRIYCVHSTQRHGSNTDPETALPNPRCLYQDTEGLNWICSHDDNKVVIYDHDWHRLGYLGKDGSIHPQPTSFARIYCFFDDGKGTLWLGSKSDGLFRLRRNSGRFDVENIRWSESGDGLPTNAIYDIQADKLGSLWLATWDCGILCIDNPHDPNGNNLNYIVLSQRCAAYPDDAVKTRRITIRPDGTMLATTTRGLLIIDDIYTSISKMQMRLHRREANRRESLTSSATMATAIDDQGRLYVATESGGVCVCEDTDLHADSLSFHHLTSREGLVSDVAFDFAMLPDGRVLVLCPNGVSLIDSNQESIESYGAKFWNISIPFNECHPMVLGDSAIALMHENGIITQPLLALTQQGFSPNIVLTSVIMGAEPVRYDIDRTDTIELSSSQRSLVIGFSALDLRTNGNLRYRTRLTPQGEKPGAWSHAGDAHELQLQDLRPGRYTLELRSSNAEGQWPDNVRTLTIIVQPKFFETWYGILLPWLFFAAVIACITWMVLRIRSIDAKRHELLQTYLALLESTTKDKIAAAASTHAAPLADAKADSPDAGEPDADEAATAEPAAQQPHSLSVLEQQFMQRLLNYVEQNISNCNASLADMAEATATSKSSLTRKTHQLLGVTPADFLKEARLKRASQLLLTTSQTLTEIALACGFSDPKYFSKCFKASTGKTPTEFRS